MLCLVRTCSNFWNMLNLLYSGTSLKELKYKKKKKKKEKKVILLVPALYMHVFLCFLTLI